MTISESNIEIQIVHQVHESITEELIRNAILIAYQEANRTYEFNISVNIRIVGNDEGLEINSKFKNKKTATNVLAFVGSPNEEAKLGVIKPSIGDIVVCYPVVEREVKESNIEIEYHFIHMVIHGFLHLLGLDHQSDLEENEMTLLEIKILNLVNI